MKTAFKIYRFNHLDSASMDVVVNTFESKGWKLPPELRAPEPMEGLTLIKGIKDYLDSD